MGSSNEVIHYNINKDSFGRQVEASVRLHRAFRNGWEVKQ